jgi:acyl-CoA synthetase (AMP-forming)/AMP-acid ligase II
VDWFAELNFAGRLLCRLGPNSCLIDATTSETLPGEDIAALVVGFAAGFLSAGLKPGDRILIGCGLNSASCLAYLGAMYAGLVPVPLDEKVLFQSGESICVKTKANGIWTEKEVRNEWIERIGLRQFAGRFKKHTVISLPPRSCAASDLAALMPTSGSTATPRLVMVSHGNLIANTEAIIRSQHLGSDERAMLILPVSYCFGASVLHTHLYQGGGIVFDSRFMFPDKVLRAINNHQCTSFAGVPMVFNILLNRSSIRSIPLPSLRRFLQAGGALAPQTVLKMCELVRTAEFYVMYGQTEATARISCLPPDRLADKLGSAGLPLDNLELRIMDDMGQQIPHGQTGEIWARGPSICAGYYEDVEETKHKFQNGWLKTGDLAYFDQEGFLWITGRKGDFMKIRGVRLSFAEVEARVAAVHGVYECAATSVPHPEAGEALELFVVPNADAIDLCDQVSRALPPHWTCNQIHIVGDLPKTSNGKLARSRLKEIA